MKKILNLAIVLFAMLIMGVSSAVAQTNQSGPVDNYGFLNAPDGTTWTYTAAFEKKYGDKVEIVRSNFFTESNEPSLIKYEKFLINEVKKHNKSFQNR